MGQGVQSCVQMKVVCRAGAVWLWSWLSAEDYWGSHREQRSGLRQTGIQTLGWEQAESAEKYEYHKVSRRSVREEVNKPVLANKSRWAGWEDDELVGGEEPEATPQPGYCWQGQTEQGQGKRSTEKQVSKFPSNHKNILQGPWIHVYWMLWLLE